MFEFKQEISKEIFFRKYALHGEKSVEEVLRGIAEEVASVELSPTDLEKAIKADIKPPKYWEYWADKFYNAMITGEFIPGGRILANARLFSMMKNYNNCFTIDIEDDMESIYLALKEDALIGKVGGGVGFNASKLRPKWAFISKGGESSGVMSFVEVFDASAKAIHTGGGRRGAHILILNVDHPDIEEFITYKRGGENNKLTQFNISVGITDEFIEAVLADKDWNLIFPLMKKEEKPSDEFLIWKKPAFDLEYAKKMDYTINEKGEVLMRIYKTVKARELYDTMTKHAWWYNEPGALFLDTIEKENNAPHHFKIDRANPCGR